MKFLKWWHKKDLELTRDAVEAKRLKKTVDEITLNGEEIWMRYNQRFEPEPEPDLKECVIQCIDEDNARLA